VQEELIKSEEERLTISQALLTMQLDLNRAQVCVIISWLCPSAALCFSSEMHAAAPAYGHSCSQ